jgi:glycerol-3-phosphate O-acyltransferase/dihydroxyacetone phosphate acyltransferase
MYLYQMSSAELTVLEQLIQAVRRLYNPKGTKLPLPRIVELNRRLVQGYTRYKDDPRVVELQKQVIAYNQRLLALNIRDHQVQYAKLNIFSCFGLFWYRILKLLVLSAFVLPGTILFGPVFIFGKLHSIKKAKQALAASNVKVQARDVMATWKLLTALAVTPLVYLAYMVSFTYWYQRNQIQGYLPAGIPSSLLYALQAIFFPTITYAALRFGETGMDIVKSLGPLIKMMIPSSNNELTKLQVRREELAKAVNRIINTLGPEMFPDFHSKRIIAEPFGSLPPQTPGGTEQEPEAFDFPASPESAKTHRDSQLPRNESFKDLSNMDFFSTRPSTPKKSRSRSGSGSGSGLGFQLKPFSTITGKDGLNEVSNRIKKSLRERARRRSSSGDGWESGMSTPGSGSEAGDMEGLSMTKRK